MYVCVCVCNEHEECKIAQSQSLQLTAVIWMTWCAKKLNKSHVIIILHIC